VTGRGPTLEQTLHFLTARGQRMTEPRRQVVEAAQKRDGPFTADDLLQELRDSGADVGRATIFRTLDLLVQHGVLDRLHQPQGCHRYVVALDAERHHHHLICSDCGTVVQFEECNVGPLLTELGRQNGFRISGHWLEVFGTCAACQS
jgi:Fur family ferric uptake transcriptional regulator